MRLFHVSESPGIARFEPRRFSGGVECDAPVVWAIDEDHVVNYLLPRDCPRVTYSVPSPPATRETKRLFLPNGPVRVVAIERAWHGRAETTPLHLYELPSESFRSIDVNAGYYVSSEVVVPVAVTRIDRPADAIRVRGAEFRVLDSLWPLHDEVVATIERFSIIRMRNASPRPPPPLP